MTEDSRLIKLFFERSGQALTLLSEKYGAICLATARNILSSEQDAEECLSDAYLAVWNKIPPERPEPLAAYLLRIVRNQALKKLRQNTAEKRGSGYGTVLEELEGCIPSRESVEDEAEAKELAKAIDRFLSSIAKDERVLFVRRYWFGDSISELAGLFSQSGHNISSRLYRTRKKLRKFLLGEGAKL